MPDEELVGMGLGDGVGIIVLAVLSVAGDGGSNISIYALRKGASE